MVRRPVASGIRSERTKIECLESGTKLGIKPLPRERRLFDLLHTAYPACALRAGHGSNRAVFLT